MKPGQPSPSVLEVVQSFRKGPVDNGFRREHNLALIGTAFQQVADRVNFRKQQNEGTAKLARELNRLPRYPMHPKPKNIKKVTPSGALRSEAAAWRGLEQHLWEEMINESAQAAQKASFHHSQRVVR
jgi:hypothetical protein